MFARLCHLTFVTLGLGFGVGCQRQAPEHEVIVAEGGAVAIARDGVSDRRAHFYTYKQQGKNVNFFIRTDVHGKTHAHLDACYSCYKYRLGYVQEGNQVVCLACRIGYDLDIPLWDFVGPCVPIGLSSRMEDSVLTVSTSALERAARFF